jgi:hypothetical protein
MVFISVCIYVSQKEHCYMALVIHIPFYVFSNEDEPLHVLNSKPEIQFGKIIMKNKTYKLFIPKHDSKLWNESGKDPSIHVLINIKN